MSNLPKRCEESFKQVTLAGAEQVVRQVSEDGSRKYLLLPRWRTLCRVRWHANWQQAFGLRFYTSRMRHGLRFLCNRSVGLTSLFRERDSRAG